MAGEQAFDVAVEDGFFLAEGEDGDGGGGAAPHALERLQPGTVARELPAVLIHDLPRGVVQVARAAVVAEAGPQREYVVIGSGGEAFDIGKAGEEARVILQDGGDLRLLQHDFREPDAVGVVALPGQVVAAVAGLPGGEAVSERGHHVWRGDVAGWKLSPSKR